MIKRNKAMHEVLAVARKETESESIVSHRVFMDWTVLVDEHRRKIGLGSYVKRVPLRSKFIHFERLCTNCSFHVVENAATKALSLHETSANMS